MSSSSSNHRGTPKKSDLLIFPLENEGQSVSLVFMKRMYSGEGVGRILALPTIYLFQLR